MLLAKLSLAVFFSAACLRCEPSTSTSSKMVRLFLVPHTHADTGWLETLDTLARLNTSRILDGVVGHLKNDTTGTKRFVWDEIIFLQLWW
jgi:hypothetical protein